MLQLAGALTALALWLVSLPFVDISDISGWGLLSAVPVTWWLALALAVLGQAAAILSGRLRPAVFWLYQAALILLLYATTASRYEFPRYPWTYKHVGVVEEMLANNVLATGDLYRWIDIYHNWPGFFLLAALVSTILSVDPLTVAHWAEPVLAFAAAGAVGYAIRALTQNRTVVWLTILLFTLGNWIGSNYYSPQALATVLGSLFLGVVLRTMPVRDAEGQIVVRSLVARLLRNRSIIGLAPTGDGLFSRQPAFGWLVATALWAALVVTHQLTPVAVAFQLAALWLLVRIRPWWLLLVWGALEVGWIASAMSFLANKFTLFQSDALADFGWPGTQLNPSLPGMVVVGLAAPVLAATLPAVAVAVGGWLFLRHRQLHLIALTLGLVPPTLLIVQTYGGEAVFRVYLYGLPWFSSLIALAMIRFWASRWLGRLLALAGLTVFTAMSSAASFGQELISYVPPGDVRASVWYETQTPERSQAIAPTGIGFPLQMTAGYPTRITTRPSLSDFIGKPPLDAGPEVALDNAVADLEAGGFREGYLAISNQQRTYAEMYGIATRRQYADLVNALYRSSTWQVVYDAEGVVIAHYRA